MDKIVALFLEYGLLGACVLVLAIVVWRLFRSLSRTQDTRVAEAQAVTDKMLALSEKFLEHVAALTSEIEKLVEKAEKMDAIERKIDGVAAAMNQHANQHAIEAARKG